MPFFVDGKEMQWRQMTVGEFISHLRKYTDPGISVFLATDKDGNGFPNGDGYENQIIVHFPNWRSMDLT